jgi:hypothetical protein
MINQRNAGEFFFKRVSFGSSQPKDESSHVCQVASAPNVRSGHLWPTGPPSWLAMARRPGFGKVKPLMAVLLAMRLNDHGCHGRILASPFISPQWTKKWQK